MMKIGSVSLFRHNKGLNKGVHMNNYNRQNYLGLIEDYTKDELDRAWKAIHCCELQEELYAEESQLLVFLIDTDLQEQLILYHEDIERNKEY